MNRLHISLGLNLILVVAIVILGVITIRSRSLPSLGLTVSTQNPMGHINQARALYQGYHQTHSRQDLVRAAADLATAGGELMVFGSNTRHSDTYNLGLILTELSQRLASPAYASTVFTDVNLLWKYLPTKMVEQNNLVTFNQDISTAFHHLPHSTTLYWNP